MRVEEGGSGNLFFCPVGSGQVFLYPAIGLLFCTAMTTAAVAVATGRVGSQTDCWYSWSELGSDVSQMAGSWLKPRERRSKCGIVEPNIMIEKYVPVKGFGSFVERREGI